MTKKYYNIKVKDSETLIIDGEEYRYELFDPSVIGLSLTKYLPAPHNERIEVKNVSLKTEVVDFLLENT